MSDREFNNEPTDNQRLADAETTLRDMLRWVDMSMEIAKSFKLGNDKDRLREQLLLTVTEGAMEDQYIEALRIVPDVDGDSDEWKKQFALPKTEVSPWVEAKRQLDANPAPFIAGGFF